MEEQTLTFAQRKVIMERNAILNTVNRPARDYYEKVLNVDNVIFDENPRTITLEDGTEAGEAYKSSYHSVDEGWIDSYTLACNSFAKLLVDSLGQGPWEEPIQITFKGQVTKRHKKDGRITDTVSLA